MLYPIELRWRHKEGRKNATRRDVQYKQQESLRIGVMLKRENWDTFVIECIL
jgi:hypothetical protein